MGGKARSKTVRMVRLRDDAVLPKYMSAGAAGFDLVAACDAPIVLAAGGGAAAVGTGLAMAIPVGYEGQVRPRSGLAFKHGVTVLNSPGTVDCDYRGEVKVLLVNHGDKSFVVEPGERIAQMVIARAEQIAIEEVRTLSATRRGAGGFGSTGTR